MKKWRGTPDLNFRPIPSLLLSLCTRKPATNASGIHFKSFLRVCTQSRDFLRAFQSSSTPEELYDLQNCRERQWKHDGGSKAKAIYMPVNFQLCAISGSKAAETYCSSANEGLIFPGLHLKPGIVNFILQCAAYFRCTFVSPAPGVQALPGSGAFQSRVLRAVGDHD